MEILAPLFIELVQCTGCLKNVGHSDLSTPIHYNYLQQQESTSEPFLDALASLEMVLTVTDFFS